MTQDLNWLQRGWAQLAGIDLGQVQKKAEDVRREWAAKNGISEAQLKAVDSLLTYRSNQAQRGIAGQVADFNRIAPAVANYQKLANQNAIEADRGYLENRGIALGQNDASIEKRTLFQTDADIAKMDANARNVLQVIGGPMQQHEQAVLNRFSQDYEKTLADRAATRAMYADLAKRELGQQNVANMLAGLGKLGGLAVALSA